jgi:uncharacterized protein
MDVLEIIAKYYPTDSKAYNILVWHSTCVAKKTLAIINKHPEWEIDKAFAYEAAMLHDIGIFMTDAPKIDCHGTFPYICHGYLGADILRKEGLPQHALVCERHTGTGISLETIVDKNLPLPHRNLEPVSLTEQIICFADKFYSKSHLDYELPIEKVRATIRKYGQQSMAKFEEWVALMG